MARIKTKAIAATVVSTIALAEYGWMLQFALVSYNDQTGTERAWNQLASIAIGGAVALNALAVGITYFCLLKFWNVDRLTALVCTLLAGVVLPSISWLFSPEIFAILLFCPAGLGLVLLFFAFGRRSRK